jgi:hypothetical protein
MAPGVEAAESAAGAGARAGTGAAAGTSVGNVITFPEIKRTPEEQEAYDAERAAEELRRHPPGPEMFPHYKGPYEGRYLTERAVKMLSAEDAATQIRELEHDMKQLMSDCRICVTSMEEFDQEAAAAVALYL